MGDGQQSLKERCHEALARGLKKHKPNAEIDGKGYVKHLADNLVDDVRLEDFETDLKQGSGQELKQGSAQKLDKFLAAHSSSALAVNTFARFKGKAVPLWLPPYGEQHVEANFERKCPAGVKGDIAPQILISSP